MLKTVEVHGERLLYDGELQAPAEVPAGVDGSLKLWERFLHDQFWHMRERRWIV
jgi:hypothetical protein